MPDKDKLKKLLPTDQDSFKEFYTEHFPKVCNSIHRIVKDPSLSKDLGQSVFIRFWKKLPTLDIKVSPGAYIQKMAINAAISHLRKHSPYQFTDFSSIENQESGYDPNEELMAHELKQNIFAAIDRLPPQCGLIFKLSRFESMTYKEIADELGISIKTVEVQMGRALKSLRKYLGR